MKFYIYTLIIVLSLSVQADDVDCDNPTTTIAMNVCAGREVENAESQLEKYVLKAEEKYATEKNIVETLRKSQEAWINYRKSYCAAIYEVWSGGTIRGVMFSGCMLKLTKDRTHTIWSDYLTYMDSTPPILPEPK
ncbi:MAG: lysozyme inhibitor LprI family protein [Candidatus Thiodiazotropha sp.]|jgi:uncharacterized protein YecT (DUF1311 family)